MEEARQVLTDAVEDCLAHQRNADWSKIKLVIRDTMNEFIWKRTKRRPYIYESSRHDVGPCQKPVRAVLQRKDYDHDPVLCQMLPVTKHDIPHVRKARMLSFQTPMYQDMPVRKS